MATQAQQPATKVMIGEVRFSYANVHVAQAINGSSDLKYSVVLLIPKTNKVLMAKIRAGIEAAKKEGVSTKWKGKLPPKIDITLHDGDEDKPDNEEYAGHYYLNCNNKRKPGIMVRQDGENYPLTNVDDFYSGCYGFATINFFPYDSAGKKGIGASLNNLLKTRDGERLSGGASAEQDFADFSDEGNDMY